MGVYNDKESTLKKVFNFRKMWIEKASTFEVPASSIYILLMSINWPSFMAKLFMTKHCLKSVQIRSFSWSVFFCFQSEYWKIWTIKNAVFGQFSRSERYIVLYLICLSWRHKFQSWWIMRIWISHEMSMAFQWYKDILKLCLKNYIFRNNVFHRGNL